MKVKVYFNLHKKLFSVVALEGPNKGRVIEHTDNIGLLNCNFRVQKAGRERVLKERRKNVHAYITGWKSDPKVDFGWTPEAHITYNPYKYSTFVEVESGDPVYKKKYCKLTVSNNKGKILTMG